MNYENEESVIIKKLSQKFVFIILISVMGTGCGKDSIPLVSSGATAADVRVDAENTSFPTLAQLEKTRAEEAGSDSELRTDSQEKFITTVANVYSLDLPIAPVSKINFTEIEKTMSTVWSNMLNEGVGPGSILGGYTTEISAIDGHEEAVFHHFLDAAFVKGRLVRMKFWLQKQDCVVDVHMPIAKWESESNLGMLPGVSDKYPVILTLKGAGDQTMKFTTFLRYE